MKLARSSAGQHGDWVGTVALLSANRSTLVRRALQFESVAVAPDSSCSGFVPLLVQAGLLMSSSAAGKTQRQYEWNL